uniref:Carboxylic ester hydrolase n=1 Tax=Parascaris univalens TaxID=6257 RepID=A0A914ZS95_PARUN
EHFWHPVVTYFARCSYEVAKRFVIEKLCKVANVRQ